MSNIIKTLNHKNWLIKFGKFLAKIIVKFKKPIFKLKKNRISKKYYSLALIFSFIILAWQVNLTSATFLAIFMAFLIYKWDDRIVAFLALIALTATPFLLIAKKESIAELLAIYAYYFLVMTLILQIITHKKGMANKGFFKKTKK